MADPITLSAATVFSAIATTFKLAEFCLALKEVSTESRIFLNLIHRVRKDLDEALRERNEKSALLEAMPGKKAYIDDTILDVKKSLNEIGLLIENARIDVEKGKGVTMKHRFEWVLSNHQKFVMREMALSTCHASLLGSINAMHAIGMSSNALAPPLAQQTASSMPVSPAASSISLIPPPEYEPLSASEMAALQDTRMLKSPSRRRPKVSKTISAPPNESLGIGTVHPSLRHQRSDSSIQDSLYGIDVSSEPANPSHSHTFSPQLPAFDFSTTNSNISPISSTNPSQFHSRSHSYSVPNITFHHHDSVSSISSDGNRPSFPYFDPSIPSDVFELEGTSETSNVSVRQGGRGSEPAYHPDYIDTGLYPTQNIRSPPSYNSEPTSPGNAQQDLVDAASAAIESQIQGSFGTSVLVESLRLSTAQERRRRARARFETR